MTLAEERMQILRMIENKQITAEEGAKLLEVIDSASTREQNEPTGPARWFRVRVTDLRTGKAKVNVNIPMGLVDVGMRMGAKFAPEMAGIDTEALIAAIKKGAHGKLVDVEDEDDGEHVEVYVE